MTSAEFQSAKSQTKAEFSTRFDSAEQRTEYFRALQLQLLVIVGMLH